MGCGGARLATAQIVFRRSSLDKAQTNTGEDDTSPDGTVGQTGGSYLYKLTKATISIDTSVLSFGPINGTFTTRSCN